MFLKKNAGLVKHCKGFIKLGEKKCLTHVLLALKHTKSINLDSLFLYHYKKHNQVLLFQRINRVISK